jgi:hypothetical protein
MSSHAVTYTLLHRRSSRAFFLARSTQHVESLRVAREVTRALAALAALIGWGGVCLLLGS